MELQAGGHDNIASDERIFFMYPLVCHFVQVIPDLYELLRVHQPSLSGRGIGTRCKAPKRSLFYSRGEYIIITGSP